MFRTPAPTPGPRLSSQTPERIHRSLHQWAQWYGSGALNRILTVRLALTLTKESKVPPSARASLTGRRSFRFRIWARRTAAPGRRWEGEGRMSWIGRKIHLYNVTIGLYMLDWWERYLFNILMVCLFWYILRYLLGFFQSNLKTLFQDGNYLVGGSA